MSGWRTIPWSVVDQLMAARAAQTPANMSIDYGRVHAHRDGITVQYVEDKDDPMPLADFEHFR